MFINVAHKHDEMEDIAQTEQLICPLDVTLKTGYCADLVKVNTCMILTFCVLH